MQPHECRSRLQPAGAFEGGLEAGRSEWFLAGTVLAWEPDIPAAQQGLLAAPSPR